MDVQQIQQALRKHKIDGWLFCDFHNRDHLAYRILGLDPTRLTSRRWFYYIPAKGEPRKLVHPVEKGKLDSLPGKKAVYLPWEQLHSSLKKVLGPAKRIAMQYSPKNNLPPVSLVDAGTVELVKSFGHRIISSADLVQIFESLIDEHGYALHKKAAAIVDTVRAEAFERIAHGIRKGDGVSEHDVTQFILKRFAEHNLLTENVPIVGSNEHPADPHFEATAENSRPFRSGDSVLIDLWAKVNAPGAIYYDITWVGYIGEAPSAQYQKIFNVVKDARDAAIAFVSRRFEKGQPCYGWEVDDACRAVVKKAGFGKLFTHRTGHSIGEEVHGNGANIDNLETKDVRRLMPGCCFSIEPGIYLEGKMAARTEINMFIRHDGVAEVTGEIQQELVKIA
jgi:Xaa-Pro dipeptidase